MNDPIRVVVADDQILLRGSFRVLIETAPELDVVGEAGTGAEAIELATAHRPDVVLMDVRMPELDGIEATRRICGPNGPGEGGLDGVRVLILTTFDLDEYVYAALRAGASGFLLKDTPPASLIGAITTVASGESLLAPSVTRRLIEEYVRRDQRPSGHDHPTVAGLAGLTDREREVLTLVARGRSNAEICADLFVSMATVKTHIGRLLAKLEARDRAQLVITAYETGLVGPPRP